MLYYAIPHLILFLLYNLSNIVKYWIFLPLSLNLARARSRPRLECILNKKVDLYTISLKPIPTSIITVVECKIFIISIG